MGYLPIDVTKMSLTSFKAFNSICFYRTIFLWTFISCIINSGSTFGQKNDIRIKSKKVSSDAVKNTDSVNVHLFVKDDSALAVIKLRYVQARSSADSTKLYEALSQITEYLFYKASYDSCMFYLVEMQRLGAKVKRQDWVAEAELHIGNVWIARLEYMKGMAQYLKALNWAEKNGNKLEASISQKIAELYIRMRRYEEALSYLNNAEQKALFFDNKFLLSLIYISKGNVFISKKYDNRKRSDEYLNKAFALAKEHKWLIVEQTALISLARNEVSDSEYNNALAHLETAEKVYDKNEGSNIQILIYRARCHLELGNTTLAEQTLGVALNLARPKRTYFISQIMGLYSKLEEKKGNYSKALDFYKQSNLYKDSIEGDNIKDSIAWLKYQYQTMEKNSELIKNKLFIQQQNEEIYRKNYLTYTLTGLCILILTISLLIFQYKQRIQKHKNEMTAWKAKVEGEEMERARIAIILHDTIGATLSTASMWFKNALYDNEPLKTNFEYKEGMKLLDDGLNAVRNGSHSLMPDFLKRLGLIEAVGAYCSNVEKTDALKIEYQYYGTFDGIDEEITLAVYRTVQELVYNVIKHAGASNVIIQLSCHEKLLSLTVEDDGRGFNTNDLKTATGIGLQNIINSTKYLNGHFNIASEPETGTMVYIEYPV